MTRIILIFAAVVMICGCSTLNDTPYARGASIHVRGQQFLCARHRTEFVTVPGFDTGSNFVCILPTERYNHLVQFYPNALGLHGSLSRSDIHTVPAQITYCLRCEEELQQRLK